MGREPFRWQVRVYYAETDAGGVVYHSRYLDFMEKARTEWLRALGIEQEALFQRTGVRFAVSRMGIRFIAPARLDDLLSVSVALTRARGASLEIAQEIRRAADGALLIRGEALIAAINGQFRPTRLPGELLARLPEAGGT